ncbi:MAG: response regulator [Bilifractor sp.]
MSDKMTGGQIVELAGRSEDKNPQSMKTGAPMAVAGTSEEVSGVPGIRKLLVAEDNRMIRMIITHALGSGYHIISGSSMEETVDEVRRERPDMIIADLDMAGLDGGAFLDRLAEADAYMIPVVFLISKKSTSAESRSLALGFRDFYIRKPFSEEDLQEKVERILNAEDTWKNLQQDVQKKPDISGEKRTIVEKSISRIFSAEDEKKDINSLPDTPGDLAGIEAYMRDEDNAFGACEVSFSEFCVMYRLMQRQRERKDVTAQIVLFTMYPREGMQKKSVEFEAAMTEFSQIVNQSLRRCDVTVRYSSGQLLAMFTDCYQKDGRMVADRIMHTWKLQDMPCDVTYEIRTFPL